MSLILMEELIKLGMELEIFKMSQKPDFEEVDLAVFSSPTHAGDAIRKMKRFIASIPENNSCYAVMTSYSYNFPHKTLEVMSSALDEKNMDKIEDIAVKIKGLRGPLPNDIRAVMRDFAEKLYLGCQARSR